MSETASYVILVHHGVKEWNNSDRRKKPYFDPGVVRGGSDHIVEQVSLLVEKYGLPDTIVVSPYRRTKMTLDSIIECCIPESHSFTVIVDPDVGEFMPSTIFKPKDESDDLFDKETIKYNPHQYESISTFRSRCAVAHMDLLERVQFGRRVLVITHGMTMKELIKIHTKKEYLEGAALHIGRTGVYKLI